MTFRRSRGHLNGHRPALKAPLPAADPDAAWRSLGLVVDWIRHADAKAAAVLAASGVAGGVLYSLVKDRGEPSVALNIAAGVSGVLIFVSAALAAFALRPRMWSKERPTSKIYYAHIARRYGKPEGGGAYSDAMLELASDGVEMTREVSSQIWANAHVAHVKFVLVNIAMNTFLLCLPFLAALPIIIFFGWG